MRSSLFMPRKLVVVVDEEARKTLEQNNFRWFSEAKKRNDGEYRLIDPCGNPIKVRGTLVEEPWLDVHSEEYLYLEITRFCSGDCYTCGPTGIVKGHDPQKGPTPYIEPIFALELAEKIRKHTSRLEKRKFFYSGGEPLIEIASFKWIRGFFDAVENTTFTIATNGLAFPLDMAALTDLVMGLGVDCIMVGYSPGHITDYEKHAREGTYKGFVPQNVKPELALAEKVRILAGYIPDHIGFSVNVVTGDGDAGIKEWLAKYCSNPRIGFINTMLDKPREPCKQGQELSIRYNGDLHPHCYDVFTNQHKLGVIGFLVE